MEFSSLLDIYAYTAVGGHTNLLSQLALYTHDGLVPIQPANMSFVVLSFVSTIQLNFCFSFGYHGIDLRQKGPRAE